MSEITVTCAKVSKEMERIDKVVDHIDDVLSMVIVTPEDHKMIIIESLALNMHDFYTGCEKVFKEIAKTIDRALPSGADWHRSLIDQMNVAIPSTRPAILSDETYELLDEYLGFRHIVRSVYAFNLDQNRVLELASGVRKAFEAMTSDVDRFCEYGALVSDSD